MPQSLSFILVHVVFSTKDRRPLLPAELRPGVHAYLATLARSNGCDCFRAGGMADHVHLAVRLSATEDLANLVKRIKASSSAWIKTQGDPAFAWQRGYGAFSVSPADCGALLEYIDDQEAHHRKRDFQQEMRTFFEKYHVAFDERYVWD